MPDPMVALEFVPEVAFMNYADLQEIFGSKALTRKTGEFSGACAFFYPVVHQKCQWGAPRPIQPCWIQWCPWNWH